MASVFFLFNLSASDVRCMRLQSHLCLRSLRLVRCSYTCFDGICDCCCIVFFVQSSVVCGVAWRGVVWYAGAESDHCRRLSSSFVETVVVNVVTLIHRWNSAEWFSGLGLFVIGPGSTGILFEYQEKQFGDHASHSDILAAVARFKAEHQSTGSAEST